MLALALAAAVTLVDQRGARFTLDDLRGAPTAVAFISTHCTDVCPLVDAQLAEAAATARRLGIPLHVLTIALEPRATLAQLRGLARRYDADPRVWRIASGSPSTIASLERAFGARARRARDGSIEHTSLVYLLDADGEPYTALPASSSLGDDLIREVRTAWLPLSR